MSCHCDILEQRGKLESIQMTTLLESAKSTVKSHHSRMLDFFWGGRCKSASREVFQQKKSIATLDGSAHFCKTSPARADTVPGRRIASLRSTVGGPCVKGLSSGGWHNRLYKGTDQLPVRGILQRLLAAPRRPSTNFPRPALLTC